MRAQDSSPCLANYYRENPIKRASPSIKLRWCPLTSCTGHNCIHTIYTRDTVFAVFDLEIHNPGAQGQTVICNLWLVRFHRKNFEVEVPLYIWLDWGSLEGIRSSFSPRGLAGGATAIRLCGLTHYITPRTNQTTLGRHREAEAADIMVIEQLLLTRS